ncbi:MAG: hypothetical protein ACJAZ0_000377 [Halioglobus sp.]|jgi:hypothetical protein
MEFHSSFGQVHHRRQRIQIKTEVGSTIFSFPRHVEVLESCRCLLQAVSLRSYKDDEQVADFIPKF